MGPSAHLRRCAVTQTPVPWSWMEAPMMETDWQEIDQWSTLRSLRAPGSSGELCVLAVDDAPESRRVWAALLGREGIRVDEAKDGMEAYRKGCHHAYDVVLMDLQMPGWDGFRTTAKLREAGFENPIIAVTAHDEPETLGRCLASGFNDHLSKRQVLTGLLRTVNHWAHHHGDLS